MKVLDEFPIAYDVDKVIEQLEEKLKLIRKEQSADCIKHDGYWTPEQGMRSGMIKAVLEDMKIVKNGGIGKLRADETERRYMDTQNG